ncbi:MAG: TetR/AcrR family transcriptional regulator [Rhizobium sp.]|nr:TetR/AcrR family transcriptional regulator [Rhizobium sp.]
MSSAKTSSRPRRRQADRRAESENRLLSAAAGLLVEKGTSAATFRNIGDRAGLSRALVTRRFGSKRGMIDVLINRLKDRGAAGLAGRHLEAVSGIDAVLVYVDAFLDNLQADREQRAYFILLAASVSDESEARSLFFETHQETAAYLQSFLRRGIAEGYIRSDLDPAAVSLTVGSLLLGLATQSLLDPQMDLESLRNAAKAILRHGIAA